MPFAEAEAQTPFFSTHTLMCETFRLIFITLHETCGCAKLTAMFFLICGCKGLSLDLLLERLTVLSVCYSSNWWCKGALYHICAKLGNVFNVKPISLTACVIKGNTYCSWKSQSHFAICGFISLISSSIYPMVILFMKESILFKHFQPDCCAQKAKI